jgi:transposase
MPASQFMKSMPRGGVRMAKVFIGVDPHKLSATIEVVDAHETVLATGRFATDKVGYAAMRKQVSAWSDRVWAVEGSGGAGRPLAQRLLADGEHVVDVPPKLSARARLFDTGHNRKTDAHDAHAVAAAAVRAKRLRVLSFNAELEVLRMMSDRRVELVRQRVQTINRLHRLLSELVPGTSKRDLTAPQAKAILASRRPRDLAGKTRKRLALEQLDDLFMIDTKIKASAKELQAMVLASGSTLMDLAGIGPIGAARILADVGDVTRFADRNRFASWTGTAPLDASSGEQIRHRLSRAGNRKMNHMLHMAATTQIRLDTEGRAYYRRKRTAGKTHLEALRCLKRRISDAVYRQLVADARAAETVTGDAAMSTGPGGQSGASLKSSAVDLPPHIDTSDQPLPGPAQPTLQPRRRGRKKAFLSTTC